MLTAVLAVLGAVGSIVGIWAYVDTQRTKRVKLLGWESSYTDVLATASKPDGDYKLSILYERPGTRPAVIKGAYVTYLRFANFGREPVRRVDLGEANPLRVVVKMDEEAEDVRVLEVSLEASSREVILLEVGDFELTKTGAEAKIDFDFLDHHDGGVVRLLTSAPAEVELVGDIIGMPQGMFRTDVPVARTFWGKIQGTVGGILWGLAEAGVLAGSIVLFHVVTGSWTDAWLLAVPVFATLGVLMGGILISESIWPTQYGRKQFPQALAGPGRRHWRTFYGPDGLYGPRMMYPHPIPESAAVESRKQAAGDPQGT